MTRIRFLLAAIGVSSLAQKQGISQKQWQSESWTAASSRRIPKPINGECPACGTVRAPITKAEHFKNLLKGDMGPYMKSQKWTAANMPDSLDVTCSYCRCHYSMDVQK